MRRLPSRVSTLGLLAVSLTVAIPSSIRAQELYFGVRGGGTSSTFGGDDANGLDSYRSGFSAGGVLGYGLSPWLQLQTELTWIQKGAEGTLQGFEEPLAVAIDSDYLQLPLLLRLTVPRSGPLRPMLLVGPAVSYELDCDARTDESELALTLGCEDTAPDDRRRSVDWSLVVGGGLTYDVGRWAILLDGRYDVGLVALHRPPETLDVKNRGFAVTAGLALSR